VQVDGLDLAKKKAPRPGGQNYFACCIKTKKAEKKKHRGGGGKELGKRPKGVHAARSRTRLALLRGKQSAAAEVLKKNRSYHSLDGAGLEDHKGALRSNKRISEWEPGKQTVAKQRPERLMFVVGTRVARRLSQ